MSGVKPSEWSAATITALHARLQPQSCIIVETTDDPKTNGENLIAAYTVAKALTPNGAALATNNRAAVIVPPGKYCLDEDAPAPTGVTITPDAVGSNPVTWYYRLWYLDGNTPTFRSLFTEESSFTIGDSTTEIIMSGFIFPIWAIGGISVLLGTTSGFYDYTTGTKFGSPKDIYGTFVDPGYGNLYPLLLPVHIHQDCTPLTIDTEFVDIIGLTTDRSLQHIYGTPEATNSGVIVQTANDVHISNLTVEILTEVESVNYDDTDSAAYFPTTNLTASIIENCHFGRAIEYEGILWCMRLSIIYSGTFINCTGGNYSFGGYGTASGNFNSCTGGDGSFGGRGTASGNFTNCTGGNYSFGGYGTASGNFTNCTGGNGSFGGRGTASGNFNYCTGGNYSFGGYGTASGNFTNCTGGNYSFGGYGTASGNFTNCTGGNGSFGGRGTASGTFSFCKMNGAEFGTIVSSVASVEIASAGTNYEVDDELTVSGGTGTSATLKVTEVDAGVITAIEILTVGAYSEEPANPVSTTGHTADATFNLTWNEGHIYGCVDDSGFIAEKNWNDPA